MKAALWARVSTDEQETANQVLQLERWAKERGWDVVQRYTVPASAYKRQHLRDIDRVIEDARQGRAFELLLVWAIDRLSRGGPLETLQLVDRIEHGGLKVYSLQEPFTTVQDDVRPLMLSFAGWVAWIESKRRSERTKAGMARAIENGTKSGLPIGRPPRSKPLDGHRSWPKVLAALDAGLMNSGEAARKLKVRKATLLAELERFRKAKRDPGALGSSS